MLRPASQSFPSRGARVTYPGSFGTSAGLCATSWFWVSMGSGAGGRTTTTSERRRGGDGSRSHSAALPTTGTRLARGAPRHAAAAAAAASPLAARAAAASIHSLRIQLFIRPARTRGAARWAPPRERAARGRAPPPAAAPRARPPRPTRARCSPTPPPCTLPKIFIYLTFISFADFPNYFHLREFLTRIIII